MFSGTQHGQLGFVFKHDFKITFLSTVAYPGFPQAEGSPPGSGMEAGQPRIITAPCQEQDNLGTPSPWHSAHPWGWGQNEDGDRLKPRQDIRSARQGQDQQE